jgi:hypothetical protein
MSLPGNYPKYLVEKLGVETLKQLSKDSPKNPNRRNNNNQSRERPMQLKVTLYAERHDRFKVGECARACVARKDVVLPILMQIPGLNITPDECCIKISGKNSTNMVSERGDR